MVEVLLLNKTLAKHGREQHSQEVFFNIHVYLLFHLILTSLLSLGNCPQSELSVN